MGSGAEDSAGYDRRPMRVYLSHATSFCGAVWDPVIGALDGLEAETWDFPGHGSGPALEPPVGWETFGEHVLEVTRPGGIGVGHSMGGAALCMAQAADPSRFEALILIEPIIYPGPFAKRSNAMADKAERRRVEFASREEAADSFRGRGAFVDWVEEAFDAYISCGLVGDGPVRLACSPALEADMYRASTAHRTWDLLGSIEVPVLLLTGELSDSITPDLARAQAAEFPSAGVEIVPGEGHFLPMTSPDLVAKRIMRLVGGIEAGQPSAL